MNDKIRYYFQQDGAPPHRAKEVQDWVKDKFGDRFLDASIWPPRSSDLKPCDFTLWGTLKSKVYNPKPSTLEELKKNIEREFKEFEKNRVKIDFFKHEKKT